MNTADLRKDELVLIGEVVNVVGIKGEIKIYSFAESRETFDSLETFILEFSEKPGKEDSFFEMKVQSLRHKGSTVIAKLYDVDDRNEGEELRGSKVYMRASMLPELPDGVYYIRDMLGMRVTDDNGADLGRLKDVDCSRPQRLYIIERPTGNDILIPGVDEFILNIDMDKGIIKVKILEGML